AIGQATHGVVLITEYFSARRVQLVGRATVLVIIPGGRLSFAVLQSQQITRRAVGVAVGGDAGIHFVGLAAHRVVGVIDHVGAELIGVAGQAGGVERVNKFLDAGVRITAREQPVQIVIGVGDGHPVGIHAVGGAVEDVVGHGRDLAKSVGHRDKQTLVVVVICHAGETADDIRHPTQRIVETGRTAAIGIIDRR